MKKFIVMAAAVSALGLVGCDSGSDVQSAREDLQETRVEAIENVNEAKEGAAENVAEAQQDAQQNVQEAKEDLAEARQERVEDADREPAAEKAQVVDGQRITPEFCAKLARNAETDPKMANAYKACSDLGYIKK